MITRVIIGFRAFHVLVLRAHDKAVHVLQSQHYLSCPPQIEALKFWPYLSNSLWPLNPVNLSVPIHTSHISPGVQHARLSS